MMMTEQKTLKAEFTYYHVGKRLPKSDTPLWFYFPKKQRWIFCKKWERSDGEWCPKNRTFFWPVEWSMDASFATKHRPTFYAYDIPKPQAPEREESE